jgi:GT2 family glycosyltransferase
VDVTVVVATVGGPWLPGQLAALAAQTRSPDQIVLVNNGPAGAVDAVVREWAPRLPGLELVEDRQLSQPGHARNVGGAHARHRGLLFLDDDDVVEPGYVAAMSAALDTAELAAARVDLQRLNPAALVRRWGDMQSSGVMTYHDFLPWSISAALAVRSETFRKLDGFDTTLEICEDTDLCWRAQRDAGARIVFVPDAEVSYRLRTGLRAAFRQARRWASWEAELYRRYEPHGLRPETGQLRALLRWGRPVLLAVNARSSEDLVVAVRSLGACIGRLEGSVRHRHLHL